MNEAKTQLLMIRGVIASMDAEEQLKIRQAEAELRAVLLKHNDYGMVALALIGAEAAAEDGR